MKSTRFSSRHLPASFSVVALATVSFCRMVPLAAAEVAHPAQPGLAEAIQSAAPLRIEKLMKGPESVWDQFIFWAPNSDGKTWDVFFIYSPRYMGPHEIYILDTGTGELKRQTMDRGYMFHLVDRFLIDGKLYIKPNVEGGKGDAFFVYDPDRNELKLGGHPFGPGVESSGGGTWALDGETLFGFVLVRGKDGEPSRYAANKLDPKTGKGELFKPIGEVHKNHDWIYSGVYKDGDWVYAKVGKAPWRLWGYNVATGEGKLIAETEVFEGNHRTIHPRRLEGPGGFEVEIDRPKGGDGSRAAYWLKDGQLTAKSGDTPPWSQTPLAHYRAPRQDPFPKPQMRRTPPDNEGKVEVTWRPAGDRNAEWQSVKFDVVRHPQPIRRMVGLPGNRLFALSESYGQAVLFDLAARKRIPLGKTMSVYSMTEHAGLVYMSGYAGAVVWQYNPDDPWTIEDRAAEIGHGATEKDFTADNESSSSNPREVARLQRETRMQNPWGGTVVGGDGRVYAAGWIIRVGNGGALGWWDPKTDKSGGLTDPFSAYPIYWMCGVSDGVTENRYLAISTKTTKDDKNPEYTPAQGKVFIFDTKEKKIIRELTPTSQSFHGPVVEATPGVVMGFVRAANGEGGMLWAANVITGELVWTRPLPAPPITNFSSIRRNAGTNLQKGPDGKVWTFLNSTLIRIDPENGEAEIVGALKDGDPGQLTFLNGEIYLAGDLRLRRIDISGQK